MSIDRELGRAMESAIRKEADRLAAEVMQPEQFARMSLAYHLGDYRQRGLREPSAPVIKRGGKRPSFLKAAMEAQAPRIRDAIRKAIRRSIAR